MSELADVSDPHGAGRGDRRRARRLVDEAYAAGRISAVDRGLRVEQVEAAATRGDLAMVVRDLTRPDQPPATASAGPAPDVPVPSVPVPPVPEPAAPPAAAPSTDETTAASAWPPPGYSGREVTPGDVRPGPNRRAIGCIIAAVAAFFLLPVVIGIIALVVGLALSGTSGSSSGGDDLPVPAVTTPF
jgi:hypothetical protein